LDAIEKAIRNAFERGNAEDRAFREKVYRSAFAALDRALQANPGVTVETAIKRRKTMQAKIAEIESEFLPAVSDGAAETGGDSPVPPVELAPAPGPAVEWPVAGPGEAAGPEQAEPPSVTIDHPAQPASETPDSPGLPVVPDIKPEPVLAGSPAAAATAGFADAEVEPDRDERRARRRRLPAASMIVGVALLAALAAGIWWGVQAGMFGIPAGPGTAAPPSSTVVDQDSTPDGEAAAPARPGDAEHGRDWITVFSPSDPTLVSAPTDAKAEVMRDDTGSFLRIRSGASGSAVSFDVGQGILEKMAGKHAVFVIAARAEEGSETQISVDCDFGELGDCGRKRYAVGRERNEFLFDVRFPDKHPGAAGAIAINSDFDKQGKSVDIYEIRVSAVP
jgi:hypothetical protein